MNQSPNNVSAEAEGTLRIALRRMAAAYPFHAHLLSASLFEARPAVSTMGVAIQHCRLTFFYAPAFVVTCSFEELTGLLHHEINHVLFGHLFDDPADFPEKQSRLIAEEVSVNEWVREPLPGQPITLSQYPQLPPEEDTDTRYRRLVQQAPNHGATGPKSGPNAPNSGASGPKTGTSRPKNGPPVPKNSPTGTKKPERLPLLEPLDDHSVWHEARHSKALERLAVSVAVQQARRQMSPEQWAALPEALRHQIDRAAAGTSAGTATEDVGGLAATRAVDWRRELRRFVGRVLEIRPVFNRPPRRFPELAGIIPGRGRRCAKPRILAVIDTSASLDALALRQICRELDRLGRTSEIVVVECDAKIQAIYQYRGPIRKVRGRGGTDLRPIFAAKFLRRHRPDVVLYFTDGEGPAPARRPHVPVMWCLTADGEKPASWGNVLRLDC